MTKILIKAERIFDGVHETLQEHGYVIADGDSIEAVGPQAEVEGCEERFEQVINLGKEVTLLPGLINMHTHMTFSSGENLLYDYEQDSYEVKMVRAVENLKSALTVGVTTIRDCGTINPIAFSIRSTVESGILVAPRVFASGAGITTTGGHCWFCCVEADSEEEVRKAVRAQVKAGADFIKVFATGGNTTPGTNPLAPQYTETQMKAVTEEARRLGKRVASHSHGIPGVINAIAARVTTIEHCSFLTEKGIEYESDQAQIIADEGIYVCPTIFQGLGKYRPEDMQEAPPQMKRFLDMQQERFELVNKLVDQGVSIVSGSDAGVPFTEFADYPGDLILSAQGTELSAAYILSSATSMAAEALGANHLGVIAPGKAADLLAVNGNPLQDIKAIAKTAMVMARGKVVSHSKI